LIGRSFSWPLTRTASIFPVPEGVDPFDALALDPKLAWFPAYAKVAGAGAGGCGEVIVMD